jgi:hypothetical protein
LIERRSARRHPGCLTIRLKDGYVALPIVLELTPLQKRGLADLTYRFFGGDAGKLHGDPVALALNLGLGDTECIDAPLDDLHRLVQRVVLVNVLEAGEVRFEDETGTATQVEAQAHFSTLKGCPRHGRAVDFDEWKVDAAPLRPGDSARQIVPGFRRPHDDEGKSGYEEDKGKQYPVFCAMQCSSLAPILSWRAITLIAPPGLRPTAFPGGLLPATESQRSI